MDSQDQFKTFAQKQLEREQELKKLQRHEEFVRRRFRRADLRLKQALYESLSLVLNGVNVVGLYFLFTPGHSVWFSLAAVTSMVGARYSCTCRTNACAANSLPYL